MIECFFFFKKKKEEERVVNDIVGFEILLWLR